MKYVTILAAACLVVAIVAIASRSPGMPESDELGLRPGGGALEPIANRMRDLEERLTRIESALARPAEPVRPTDVSDSHVQLVGPASLKDLWRDPTLKNFVRQSIEEYEIERLARERREDARREEEYQRFSEGPFGAYNYTVNLLADRLELGAAQKERLHALLERRDELTTAVHADEEARPEDSEGESREWVTERLEEIDSWLEDAFLALLSRDQLQFYDGLPNFEKLSVM